MTVGRRSFASDNFAGAHADVMHAIADANVGDAAAYGDDQWTRAAAGQLAAAFCASDAYFVFTGTAANVLGISLLLRPFEAVICAESSHLHVDECGAAERILGCKLLPVATPDGKLTPELIETRLTGRGDEHRVQPRVVEIAQVTELGTCYSLPELRALREFCDAEDLRLFMDGARLANAAAYLDCDLADLADCMDVVTFGGTKNGAIAAEAVLVMRDDLLPDAKFLRKQQMQLGSKMRFIAAQFGALLEDKLWLRNAQHANAMAQRLANAVEGVPGVALSYPVQSNAVFAALRADHVEALGHGWSFSTSNTNDGIVRWMTSFDTTADDIDAFSAAIRAAVT